MKTVIIAVTAVSRSSINCSLCTNGGGKGFFFLVFCNYHNAGKCVNFVCPLLW